MVTSASGAATLRESVGDWGLRRSLGLLRAFRAEQTDPDRFYGLQAADSVAQLARYGDLDGGIVVDVGGGAGYFTEALARAGARCILVEPGAAHPDDLDGTRTVAGSSDGNGECADRARREHHRHAVRVGRLAPGRTVAGDGNRLPLPDGVADVTFSSNVLEHVPTPRRFLEEMVRVTRPRGLVYLAFTTWLSPWGGHETSPWHYLGGRRAARRYEQRYGHPPHNRYGTSLFARHVGPMLRLVRSHPGVEVIDARPRYYPDWARWVVRLPGAREVVTWNLLLVLRRKEVDR